jgi:DNA-binding transcriptional LysR family regulator
MHSIRQFELVKALPTYRHFGRVAAALGVSQPALTRSLKHLEVRLGVPLFDRQGVMPTVFGQLVLSHGEAVIKGFADLVREINLAKGLEIGEFDVAAGRIPPKFRGSAQSACFPRSVPGFLSSSSSSTGRKSSIRC